MTALLNLPDSAKKMALVQGVEDHFHGYIDNNLWTAIISNSGSAAILDGGNSAIRLLPSDGTVADDDEIYLEGEGESFLFADAKPLIFEARVRPTGGDNVNDMALLVGLMDAIAADAIVDGGATPKTTYSGAVFFKAEGAATWTAENSVSTTQKTTLLSAANSLNGVAQTITSATWQKLRIEVEAYSTIDHRLSFFIDDVLVARHSQQDMTSATDMQIVFGIKNGAATNVDSLDIDYVFCYQKI